MSEEHKEADYPRPMSFPALVFWTGLVGGIFWGLMGYLAYIFHFTEVGPNVVLEPWALGQWKKEGLGTAISIILMGAFSIVAAFIYYAVLKKYTGIRVGIGYGIVLFLLVFIVLNPIFPGIKPLTELKRDTIITSVCLYILYGVFVGYSINYEYQNHVHQKNEPAT